MPEILIHILLIWGLSSLFSILVYNKLVVSKRVEYNMYTGRGAKYNKRKARRTYLKILIICGLLSAAIFYTLMFFS